MGPDVDLGLDALARFGWTSRPGIGLAVEGEYAPLRRDLANVDSHLFVVGGGPRFTLGHGVARRWVYLGGGLVVERILTDLTGATRIETETATVARGSVGLDLHLFSNGGLLFGATYTRELADDPDYDFLSLFAGLVFTL